jgi:hypothetical protein
VLHRLEVVSRRVKVQDSYLSSWLDLTFTVLKVDSADVLTIQTAALGFVSTLFLREPRQRMQILDLLVSNAIGKGEVSKKKLRNFTVLGEDNKVTRL